MNTFRIALLFRHSIPVPGCMVNEKKSEKVGQNVPELTKARFRRMNGCLAGKQNSDRQFSDETFEKKRTVEVTRMHKCRAFGVGHHAKHIPPCVADSGDIVQ